MPLAPGPWPRPRPLPPAHTQAGDLLEGAAHRIVRLLVRQRWTAADLDSLPWGVALPLRQVRAAGGCSSEGGGEAGALRWHGTC